MSKKDKLREILFRLYCEGDLGLEPNETKSINDALSQIEAVYRVDEGEIEKVCLKAIEDWLGGCNCISAYKDRDLKDPQCQWCDNQGMEKDLAKAIAQYCNE